MRKGTVVTMTACTLSKPGDRTKTGYKADKGCNFVFVFLGTETPDDPMDVIGEMKKLGWEPKEVLP